MKHPCIKTTGPLVIENSGRIDPSGSVKGYVHNFPMAYVYLSKEDDVVTIVKVKSCMLPLKAWLPFLKFVVYFRGKGYGTKLLVHTIDYCKSQGVKKIQGTAHGDLDRLIPFYKKHGFVVDENNNIELNLENTEKEN